MTLEDRVVRLEDQLAQANRRLRFAISVITGCAILALVCWLLGPTRSFAQSGASRSKEIRASSFVLEDAQGKSRAEMSMTKQTVQLRLFDDKGKARAEISTSDLGPRLGMFDEAGLPLIMLLAPPRIGPSLSLGGLSTGANSITIQASAVMGGSPSLDITDGKGKPAVILAAGGNGRGPFFSLADKDQRGSAALTLLDTGPALSLADKSGTTARGNRRTPRRSRRDSL